MRHLRTRRSPWPARASGGAWWASCALLALALQGCGSAASPRWAGARPEEAPAPPDTETVRGPAAQTPVPPPSAPVARPPAPPGKPGEVGPAEVVVEVPTLVPAGGEGYRIGVGDELTIDMPVDRELSTSVVVRPDGMITPPMLQEVRAAGRTTAELDSVMTGVYATYYRHPVVTVGVKKVAANQVYIMGEVPSPGATEIPGSMSLLQLIAKSGGVKTSGTLKSVVLLRRGPGHQVVARRVNVARILEGRPDAPDVALVPTDIVYVPRSFIGKLDLFVDQYINGIVMPVTGGYLRGWEIVQPDRFFFNPNSNRPSQATGTSAP